MDRRTANNLAMILTTVGVLFMIAMAFDIFGNRTLTLFLGVASFIVAGLVKRLGGAT